MRLTRTERMMLRGDMGEACRRSMELLLAIADAYGYGKLIKIRSAHISGISYKNIGDSGLEFIRDLAESGGFVRVKATMNPCGFDLDKPWLFDVDEEFYKKQMEIVRLLKLMGVEETLTCTPYYAGNNPREGDHIAWAESSAVIYSNSVLGAYTDREGGPSALAAALTGRAALTPAHTDEGRMPEVKVKVHYKPRDYADWGLLGYVVGMREPRLIPLLEGVKAGSRDELKYLSAGFGASSSAPMFWLKRGEKECKGGVIEVDVSEVKSVREKWSLTRRPTVVFIGCPHCSLKELRSIAEELKEKRVRRDVKLLISTSRSVYERAVKEGVEEVIRRSGGLLVKDTCLIVSPMRLSKSDVILTDSAKTAHYAQTMTRAMIALGGRRRCLREAVES